MCNKSPRFSRPDLVFSRIRDVTLLDFAKAFDKVPHKRLALKFQAYGISDNLLNWICDILFDRKKRVVLGEHVSEWANVTSGPQGSVLGPILFVIYIKDLLSVVENFPCKLYADESKIIADLTDCENLQFDLNAIVNWTDKWLMKHNFDKCKVMHIRRGNPTRNYFMFDSAMSTTFILAKTVKERDLGIKISSDSK